MMETTENAFEKLDACIHCGMCLPTCPTYRVTGSEAESPRGRLYLMRELHEGRLEDPSQLSAHLDPCLGCLGCVTACPSGVEYGTLLTASREQLLEHQPRLLRWWRRLLLQKLLPNPKLLNILSGFTRFYTLSGLQLLVREWGLPRLGGYFGKLEQFTPTIQSGRPVAVGQRFGKNEKGRVVFFVGCIMNAAYNQTHRASIEVLIRNGYEVLIPEQTCCGALAHHSGEQDIAASLATQNIEFLLAESPDWIVVNAAGCGSTMKEYHHILQNDPKAKIFADKVVDIMELLAKHPLEGPLTPVPMKVTYHAACHLHHAQGVQQEPYTVLNQIPGLQLIPLVEADMCCGSAGVYNLAHPDMSVAILETKMGHLKNTGAEAVLAANPGCMLQLESGIQSEQLEMAVLHPMDLLVKAYRPRP